MNRIFSFFGLVPQREKKIKRFIFIFYLVGALGLALPWSRLYFQFLIPWALLLSFIVLLAYYAEKISRRTAWVFTGIALTGFAVEILGVQTGVIFGHYRYGTSLGPLIAGVPPLIGINWLLLTCLSASVAGLWFRHSFGRITSASLMMLLYDLLLEQVAPKLDMWYFEGGLPGWKNYIAWLVFSFIFQSIFWIARVPVKNLVALLLFAMQFLFFVVLYFVL